MDINDRINYLEKQVRGLRSIVKRIESKIDLIDKKITVNNESNKQTIKCTLPPVTDGLTPQCMLPPVKDTLIGCNICSNYSQYPFGCGNCQGFLK